MGFVNTILGLAYNAIFVRMNMGNHQKLVDFALQSWYYKFYLYVRLL